MDLRPFSRLLLGSSNILPMWERKSSAPYNYLTTVDECESPELRSGFGLSRVVWRSPLLPKSNTGQPERSGQRAFLTGLSALSLALWLVNSEAFRLSCQVVRKIFIRLLGS